VNPSPLVGASSDANGDVSRVNDFSTLGDRSITRSVIEPGPAVLS
jgi:hypothetical protein